METALEKKELKKFDDASCAPKLLVSDIIKHTKWFPGKAYSSTQKPDLTVFFPTFSRAKSGLFKKSIDSILAQTLKNIEIIVIDDGSTDGTHEIIHEYMQKDPRISLLHHPFNVGLPSLSCYEAFLKARSDYFVFGFDNNYYYPKAFEKLYDVARKKTNSFCYGNVMLHGPNGEKILLGRNDHHVSILTHNFIPNGGVILSRKIIETIGFLDPHISLIRLCDWTYWQRITNFFPIEHIDILISDEFGPSTNDSLGNIHSVDYFVSQDRADQYFYQTLDIETFPKIDVFSYQEFKSIDNQIKVIDQALHHLKSRDFLKRISQFSKREYNLIPSKKIIVLKQHITASETLCFSYLPKYLCQHQVILTNHIKLQDLIKADVIILARDIDAFKNEVELCMKLGIPIYYFTDDNFVELKKEFSELSQSFEKKLFRAKLQKYSGCILTSPNLVNYFREQLLHDNIYYFPPAYAANQLVSTTKVKKEYDLTILILSGPHRHQDLISNIFPAIYQLSKNNIKIHLIVGNFNEEDFFGAFSDSEKIKTTALKVEFDWKQLLIKTSVYCPDVIIHPYSSCSLNQIYKTHNIALVANLLDALLIVPNAAPFSDEEFQDASFIIQEQNNPILYLNALKKVLTDSNLCQQIKLNNNKFCEERFNGKENLDVINKIAACSPTLSSEIFIKRQEYLIQYLNNRKPDIYHAPTNTFFSNSIALSLLELSQNRSIICKYQKLRFFWKKPASLWPLLEYKFPKLMSFEKFRNFNRQGYVLERSTPLEPEKVIDIFLDVTSLDVSTIACAFLTEGIFEGKFNIELWSCNGKKIFEREYKIIESDINNEFLINLQNQIDCLGLWNLKIKVSSDYPIYLLEFNQYRCLNLKRKLGSYFVCLMK